MADTKPTWGPAQDQSLLNELDDLIRKRMHVQEKAGATPDELTTLADEYGRMYDLLDVLMNEEAGGETQAFLETTFAFFEELLYEKLERIYDPDVQIDETQAKQFIRQTRHKIRRLEELLFNRPFT